MLDRSRRPVDEPTEGDTRFPSKPPWLISSPNSRTSNPLELLAEELSGLGVVATICGRTSPGNPTYLRVGGQDGENVLVAGGQFGFGFGSLIAPVAEPKAAALHIQRFLASR